MNYPVSDHQISLAEAITLTANFRAKQPPGTALSETFSLGPVNALAAFPGAAYLRIYNGMREDGTIVMILVAAGTDGNDLLPPLQSSESMTDEPPVLEDGFRCPQYCPTDSPLSGS